MKDGEENVGADQEDKQEKKVEEKEGKKKKNKTKRERENRSRVVITNGHCRYFLDRIYNTYFYLYREVATVRQV